MARTWLSIRVEIVSGHGELLWPRPGRIFAAAPKHTFAELALAINEAFARWELSHLSAFTLADGTRISHADRFFDPLPGTIEIATEKLRRLEPGDQFAYTFDFGDDWNHLCTVDEAKIDPEDAVGIVPDRPLPYFGWGTIPDQHGRRFDDGGWGDETPLPPDPQGSDLPPILPEWAWYRDDGPTGAEVAARIAGEPQFVPDASLTMGVAVTTIDDALDAFLADESERLSDRTFNRYVDVIELFRVSINGYGHDILDDLEARRWQLTADRDDEAELTGFVGPERIPELTSPFLGWFMATKVAAGKDLLKATGTVMKRLGQWLRDNGHVDETRAELLIAAAAEAGRDLPRAEELADALYEASLRCPRHDPDALGDDDVIDDQFMIARVEGDALWLNDGIGPVEVGRDVTALAEPGWAFTALLVRIDGRWYLAETGDVSP